MYVRACVPPDWCPSPIPPDPLPLTSVLVIDLAGGVPAIQAAVDVHETNPWCPVCVVVPAAPLEVAILGAMRSLSRALLVERQARDPWLSGSAIVSALRAAPEPGSDRMAEYIVGRTNGGDLAYVLSACLAPAWQSGQKSHAPSRSTLSRWLSAFGSLSARDWRAVARLIRALHRPPHPDASVEQIAWAHQLDPRTLRESSVRYLGMTARDAAERPGWEWKLETVLRRFGYAGARAAGK